MLSKTTTQSPQLLRNSSLATSIDLKKNTNMIFPHSQPIQITKKCIKFFINITIQERRAANKNICKTSFSETKIFVSLKHTLQSSIHMHGFTFNDSNIRIFQEYNHLWKIPSFLLSFNLIESFSSINDWRYLFRILKS